MAGRKKSGGAQLPMFPPESDWRPPDMSSLPDWGDARRVAVDTETCDPHIKSLGIGVRRGGYTVGYSFAIEDGPSFYLPTRHQGGDNLPRDKVVGYLREQAKKFRGELVGAHLAYDLDYLWEDGIKFPGVTYYRDVQVADPLIYELHDRYSLNTLCERYGLAPKDETLLAEAADTYGVDPKAGLWRLPARYVGAYGEGDAERPLDILRRQERRIDDLDLWGIYNLESRVLPVLVRMRRRGIRIDLDRLRGIEDWSHAQETDALNRVRHETGVRIEVGDVWKAGAIVPALHRLGLEVPRTSGGADSVKAEWLEKVDHPVADAIVWARKVNKLRTTFAASIREHICGDRVHSTFNQIAREDEASGDMRGVRYGRLSSEHPNMQQQPSREGEFAQRWRQIFVADEGEDWWKADFSQQEPRWTTHFAAAANCRGAREAARAYHEDPRIDNHQFMADVTGLPRTQAKGIYLGLCYGEGGAKLCRTLGLPTRWACSHTGDDGRRRIEYFETRDQAIDFGRSYDRKYIWEAAGEEGQSILDKFDDRAPYVRAVSRLASDAAKKRGWVQTILERRLNFPIKANGAEFDWAHKALNRVIQGSGADQVKKAVVDIDAEMPDLNLFLQVHDELDFGTGSRAQGLRVVEIMRECVPALVPFRVDPEIGPSWGELKMLEDL